MTGGEALHEHIAAFQEGGLVAGHHLFARGEVRGHAAALVAVPRLHDDGNPDLLRGGPGVLVSPAVQLDGARGGREGLPPAQQQERAEEGERGGGQELRLEGEAGAVGEEEAVLRGLRRDEGGGEGEEALGEAPLGGAEPAGQRCKEGGANLGNRRKPCRDPPRGERRSKRGKYTAAATPRTRTMV